MSHVKESTTVTQWLNYKILTCTHTYVLYRDFQIQSYKYTVMIRMYIVHTYIQLYIHYMYTHAYRHAWDRILRILLRTSTTSLMCDNDFSHFCTLSMNGPTNRDADILCRFIALSSSVTTISSTEPRMTPLSCVPFMYLYSVNHSDIICRALLR